MEPRHRKRLAGVLGIALICQLIAAAPSAAAEVLLSQNKPVLTSSNEDSTMTGPKAVDGNAATRWASVEGVDPQWIRVDLGSVRAVSRIKLNWEAAYAKTYRVEFSNDGTTWTTKYTTSAGTAGIKEITTATGDTRYVRVYGTQRGTAYGYSLWEFEVYGTDSTPPPDTLLSAGKPATASSTEASGFGPEKAVDSNTTTRWASLEGADPQWLRVDLGSTATITRVKLNWEAAYGKAYTVQVSPDGNTWTTAVTVTNGNGAIDEHTGLSVQGRYVRVHGTQRGTAYGYSLWEFEVFGTAGNPPATKLKWAGVRSSTYGIRDGAQIPFPTSAQWESAMKTMSGYFPGSTPSASIWLVGEVDFANHGMVLEFPRPNDGVNYGPLYQFQTADKHEPYLSYFDTHGIGVYLQIEPGDADIPTLIDLVLNRYKHHPSVLGLAIDAEWINKTSATDIETPVSNAQAQAWEQRVKGHKAGYRLILKHFNEANLPPTHRGDIIFVCDDELNGTYATFLAEHKKFADHFYPSDVMFQIGYPSDRPWWSQRPTPIPQSIGRDLSAQTRQNHGVLWVDFSIDDPLIDLIPNGGGGGSFVVVAAGDIAGSCRASDGLACEHERTARLVESINPTWVLTAGDNQYDEGTLSEFNNYYNTTWGRFKAKTKPTPGNHEYAEGESNAEGYKAYFGNIAMPNGTTYYSFNQGNWHFIALDSEISMSNSSAQLNWLRADLAANTKRCVAAYWHKPLFNSGSKGYDPRSLPAWQALYNAGADLIINGHDHVYERFTPQNPNAGADVAGPVAITVGLGGADNYSFEYPVAPNSVKRMTDLYGVLKLTLTDTTFTGQLVDDSGAVRDTTPTYTCH
ncbi:discoidin domain-containing protein [Catelliglobosispora koreensis]|uniref:discoidin domain-containing protein n=1 Tax=Catelliglobosispora koreensis TaxID=129052 RepID=UPI0003799835|nr:discoidin domain-containing protein [Catelliglobosispora koreensis]